MSSSSPSLPLLRAHAGILMIVLALAATACHRTNAPYNVVILTVCSLRADHLGCYGYPRATSPNIDAFARRATLFERAYTAWPKTAPSFSAVMTGTYAHTNTVMRVTPDQRLPDESVTLAEVLHGRGYKNAAFISTPAINTAVHLDQGFDIYRETFRHPDRRERFAAAVREGSEWIQAQKRPYFAWIHVSNPHYPYDPYPQGADRFVDDAYYDASVRLPVNQQPLQLPLDPAHPYAHQILRPDIGGIHPRAALRGRTNERDFYIARHDAAIRDADTLLGDLLDALLATNDTIVVLLADHGESLGNHNYYFEHGRFPYDDCVHVPLLIYAPHAAWQQGRRVTNDVSLIDVMPTVLELAGAEAPPTIEGTSLVQEVTGNPPPRPVFGEAGYQLDYTTSVRLDRWKLIHVHNEIDRQLMQGTEYELYDLQQDPQEQHNLVGNGGPLEESLRTRLAAWEQPWYASVTSAVMTKGQTPPDPQVIEQLRSLGYIH